MMAANPLIAHWSEINSQARREITAGNPSRKGWGGFFVCDYWQNTIASLDATQSLSK